jgi:RNA polymerase sigma-70 factor (ECF subfamily)
MSESSSTAPNPADGCGAVIVRNLFDMGGNDEIRDRRPYEPLMTCPPDRQDSPARDFTAFFNATLDPLRRYLSRLVGSRHDAQDIAQDAYSRVYSVMRDRDLEHPKAFLYATAHNLALDELKHRTRSPFHANPSQDEAAAGSPGVEAVVMAREELSMLEDAINRLPEDCRQVILLRMAERLTHEEVGERLGLTKKQAEKRLHRAVRLLHEAVRAPGGSP